MLSDVIKSFPKGENYKTITKEIDGKKKVSFKFGKTTLESKDVEHFKVPMPVIEHLKLDKGLANRRWKAKNISDDMKLEMKDARGKAQLLNALLQIDKIETGLLNKCKNKAFGFDSDAVEIFTQKCLDVVENLSRNLKGVKDKDEAEVIEIM